MIITVSVLELWVGSTGEDVTATSPALSGHIVAVHLVSTVLRCPWCLWYECRLVDRGRTGQDRALRYLAPAGSALLKGCTECRVCKMDDFQYCPS